MAAGGARVGAGRPTKAATALKQKAAKQELTREARATKTALAAAKRHINEAAKAGEKWAIEKILEYEIGRPSQKVMTTPDTTINLIARFPRGPFHCPKCGYEDRGVGKQEPDVGETQAQPGERDDQGAAPAS